MNENALFYTFSTVAQTLAAGFAVLAAFVLYRLRDVETGIYEADKAFKMQSVISANEIWLLIAEKGGQEALNVYYERAKDKPDSLNPAFHKTLSAACLWLETWTLSHVWLRISLLVTVVDVAMCFMALPFVPYLSSGNCGFILALISVAVGIVALGVYVKLIFVLLATASPETERILFPKGRFGYRVHLTLRMRLRKLKLLWEKHRCD